MFRFIAFTWGLAAAWAWVVFTDSGRSTGLIGFIAVGSITLGLFFFMVRRSNRLSGSHEYVNARLEYHRGFSQNRWKRSKPARGDDGGSELTLGSGW
jgi:hypothetical protein